MNITVNGEEMTVESVGTIEVLLQVLKINLKGCAVERNREIIPRSEFASTPVEEGDHLEVIQMVGGG